MKEKKPRKWINPTTHIYFIYEDPVNDREFYAFNKEHLLAQLKYLKEEWSSQEIIREWNIIGSINPRTGEIVKYENSA
jgi:primosomal protein N''